MATPGGGCSESCECEGTAEHAHEEERARAPNGGAGRLVRALKIASGVLAALFVTAYPLAIWFGLSHFSVRTVAVLILALVLPTAAIRIWRHRAQAKQFAGLALSAAFLALLAMVLNDGRLMMAYPVIVSAVMLCQFGWTLFSPPPMAERFARMQTSCLNEREIAYCRRVTQLWCGFFVVNGGLSSFLALWAGRDAWALYTGLLAYIAMGLLFTAEFAVRKFKFRHHPPANPLDRLADRFFPPGGDDRAARERELAAKAAGQSLKSLS